MRIAATVLLVILSLAIIPIALKTYRVLDETERGMIQVKLAATSVAEYARTQKEVLLSDKNQKAIEAGIQAAAAFKGTALLLNTRVIPRLTTTIESANNAVIGLDSLVRNTDRNLNGSLLPELNELAKTLNVQTASLMHGVENLVGSGKISMDEIASIVGSPEWKESLAHIDKILNNVAAASEKAPTIAASLDKIAKTSSKYQKAQLLVTVLANLARAFY